MRTKSRQNNSAAKQNSLNTNPLYLPSQKRINCDELLNQYLQQSLSFDIVNQVDNTKNWLKNNKKQGRKVNQIARRELEKTIRSKRMPEKYFISTQNKSLNKLILSAQPKPIPNKIFNQICLDKLLQGRKQNEFRSNINSISHAKNIQNYLKQLFKLQIMTKGQRATTKQYRNFNEFSINKQCMTSRECNIQDEKSDRSQRDKFSPQKTQVQFRLKLMNNTEHEWKSLFTNRVLKQNYKVSKENFHPFLEKTSNMLYQPKKKNNKNWKFQIVRHRAGIYI